VAAHVSRQPRDVLARPLHLDSVEDLRSNIDARYGPKAAYQKVKSKIIRSESESDYSAAFLEGGGELGALIRAKNWSRTPLGSPVAWPQSLLGAQAYPDLQRRISAVLRQRASRALGEDYSVTWASAWPVIGESFERALAGETRYLENQRMFLPRLENGALEEKFFTFSHSPIRDEGGQIGGLFHPVTETTPTMLAERRMRALRELGASLAQAKDEAQVSAQGVAVLAAFEFDLPFVLYYQLDVKINRYRLVAHHRIHSNVIPSLFEIAADQTDPWPFDEALGKRQIIEASTPSILGQGVCGPYPEVPSRIFILPISVARAARTQTVIVTGASARLPMNEAYRTFYSLLGVTLANALATVRALSKAIVPGSSVASFRYGKRRLFRLVDQNRGYLPGHRRSQEADRGCAPEGTRADEVRLTVLLFCPAVLEAL
jgi:hypothetical protein